MSDIQEALSHLKQFADTGIYRGNPYQDWVALRDMANTPIPIILFCPVCGTQHIDQEQPQKDWNNPPHRSHECQACGIVWRICDRNTIGVKEIYSKGTRDISFEDIHNAILKWKASNG